MKLTFVVSVLMLLLLVHSDLGEARSRKNKNKGVKGHKGGKHHGHGHSGRHGGRHGGKHGGKHGGSHGHGSSGRPGRYFGDDDYVGRRGTKEHLKEKFRDFRRGAGQLGSKLLNGLGNVMDRLNGNIDINIRVESHHHGHHEHSSRD